MIRVLLPLSLLFAALPATAQPALQGCTDATPQAIDLVGRTVGQYTSRWFDFKTIPSATPLTAQAPPAVQTVCTVIGQEAPPEDAWRKLSFFDAGSYYLLVTHPYDPDPTDDEIIVGIVSVGVYTRSGQYVQAISF